MVTPDLLEPLRVTVEAALEKKGFQIVVLDVAELTSYTDGFVLCSAANCPQPDGACCLANGSCLDLPESSCIGIPGAVWAGPLTDCTDADTNGTADSYRS